MGKIGLQLWSVKEDCEKDFVGTLKEIAKIGYDGIELDGYFGGLSAKELKKVLDDLGLVACSSHSDISLLKNDLSKEIEFQKTAGNNHLVCPILDNELRDTKEKWLGLSEFFNQVGKKCKEQGADFGYHNHNFEFEKFDGQYAYDILAENTDPDLVHFQIDTFWVEYSGLNVLQLMEKYNYRLGDLIHIKDMKSRTNQISTEIGSGVLDFNQIINRGKQYGIEWYIVEQEHFDKPNLQSVREGHDYLRTII